MSVPGEGQPLHLLRLLADLDDLPALVPGVEAWLLAHLRVGAVRVYVLSDDGGELTRFRAGGGTAASLPTGAAGGPAGRAAGEGCTATGTDSAGATWTALPLWDRAKDVVGVVEICRDQAAEPWDAAAAAAVDEPQGAAAAVDEPRAAAAVELVGPLLATARRWRRAAARADAAERFAERTIMTHEAECARLAREIHDGVSQRLAGLGFHLSAAASLCGSSDPGSTSAVRAALTTARRLACLAGAETRAAIGDLRPAVLDDFGLDAALASLGREAGQTPGGPQVTISVTGGPDPTWRAGPDPGRVSSGRTSDLGSSGRALPEHVQTALYRIAQECLANAVRHARASTVRVRLDYAATSVHLTVEDDGAGFMLDGDRVVGGRADSFGLRGMRERAELLGGSLRVSSALGSGTAVRASIPLPSPVRRDRERRDREQQRDRD